MKSPWMKFLALLVLAATAAACSLATSSSDSDATEPRTQQHSDGPPGQTGPDQTDASGDDQSEDETAAEHRDHFEEAQEFADKYPWFPLEPYHDAADNVPEDSSCEAPECNFADIEINDRWMGHYSERADAYEEIDFEGVRFEKTSRRLIVRYKGLVFEDCNTPTGAEIRRDDSRLSLHLTIGDTWEESVLIFCEDTAVMADVTVEVELPDGVEGIEIVEATVDESVTTGLAGSNPETFQSTRRFGENEPD